MARLSPFALLLALALPAGLAGCVQMDTYLPHVAPTAVHLDGPTASVSVPVLAVAQTQQGDVGVEYTATVVVVPGSGIVYVATLPATETDTQASATTAAEVAAQQAGVAFAAYDYLVHFTSDAELVGGPSAGAAMALAFYVALHDLADPAHRLAIDPHTAMTGTIETDGSIGLIGGAIANAHAVHDAGLTTFLYPQGQTGEQTQMSRSGRFARTVSVSMDPTCKDLALECGEVANLGDLVKAATTAA
jgi:uncharacterized protein